ncbi:tetratricopeptide repeat protein [Streptomyces virginiae]|uniref:tetratricopeptide repeat protein n=1 Tax=Streptomyces virginiae TaxID=1961 RepID=UPI003677FFF1
MATATHGSVPLARQSVRAESGFAYGVIGADLHVRGDGSPLYLLGEWEPPAAVSTSWLLELPSRMLNARHAVVGFAGRHAELGSLHAWLAEDERLSVRWLHGSGGQGKTRLADQLATEAHAQGWKTVVATYAAGEVVRSGSHDLRVEGRAGLLVIVDYADRWPLSHLNWLLGNTLLHRSGVPTRVLLLARTDAAWPPVAEAAEGRGAASSRQRLDPLPATAEAREEMFHAARDAFARRYGLGDTRGIVPAVPLDTEGMGLTLAVHISALVAVDSRVSDRPTPEDPAGLTVYLLDREHLHWARSADDGFGTGPEVMNHTVFVAALTGPQRHDEGGGLLRASGVQGPAEQILADHARCYPPGCSGEPTVLEPLYPDRLAEDFLALTLPGHAVGDYPTREWAAPTSRLLTVRDERGEAPAHLPRTLTFLASAAAPDRWPHLTRHVEEILRADPALALQAGSAALTALAGADLSLETLQAVEERFPEGRHVDLDTGIAALAGRLADLRLSRTDDAVARAEELDRLGVRLGFAGRHAEALARARESLDTWRGLAVADPGNHGAGLAGALTGLGYCLAQVGLREQAVGPAQEAVRIRRRAIGAGGGSGSEVPGPEAHEGLAAALNELGIRLSEVGRREDAVTAAAEAVALRRRLAETDPARYEDGLATALNNLATFLARSGRRTETLDIAREVLAIQRRLAAADRAAHEPDLASALNNLGIHLWEARRMEEAHVPTREAVEIRRRLAGVNPAAYEPHLADALANLGAHLSGAGLLQEAVPPTAEAVAIQRRLAQADPATYEPDLAWTLSNLGAHLGMVERTAEALTVTEEAVAVLRRLAAAGPLVHEPDLASALGNLATFLIGSDRVEEAGEAADETVALYRRLAAREPALYEPPLLHTLWVIASEHRESRPHAALEAALEAVTLCRRLWDADPETYASDLRIVRTAHADVLRRLGRAVEAEAILREIDEEDGG